MSTNWNLEKKTAFAKSMSKKLPKYAKGGAVKRLSNLRYFDDGGTVLSGPSSVSNNSQTVNNNGLTGTIGNLLGTNDEFQAQGAPIQAGANQAQLNKAYQDTQGALGQQQAYADQLNPQGAQGAATQTALTGQLQGVINGTGPNAAQAALNQNTANNVAAQAALMAGQRGASSNAGLLARQAAMQGAATQQQAVGQGATLQAQQQIAAQQQLADLAQAQIGQQGSAVQGLNNAQQNEQNILQGANTAYNNANVSMQSNINTVNAGTAQANQKNAQNIVSGIGSALGGVPIVGDVLGGLFAKGGEVPHLAEGGPLMVQRGGAHHGMQGPWLNSNPVSTAIAMDSSQIPASATGYSSKEKSVPAKLPKEPPSYTDQNFTKPEFGSELESSSSGPNLGVTDADQAASASSGYSLGANTGDLSAIGGDLSLLNKGGEIPHMDQGGMMQNILKLAPLAALLLDKGGDVHASFYGHFKNYFGGGNADKVPAMVSPGEVYLSPEKVRQVIQEGKNPLKIGEKIRGKAKKKGDSLKNDTIPKTLEEGGVVIPRHVTNKMSPEKAELFVHRAIAKKKSGGKLK